MLRITDSIEERFRQLKNAFTEAMYPYGTRYQCAINTTIEDSYRFLEAFLKSEIFLQEMAYWRNHPTVKLLETYREFSEVDNKYQLRCGPNQVRVVYFTEKAEPRYFAVSRGNHEYFSINFKEDEKLNKILRDNHCAYYDHIDEIKKASSAIRDFIFPANESRPYDFTVSKMHEVQKMIGLFKEQWGKDVILSLEINLKRATACFEFGDRFKFCGYNESSNHPLNLIGFDVPEYKNIAKISIGLNEDCLVLTSNPSALFTAINAMNNGWTKVNMLKR